MRYEYLLGGMAFLATVSLADELPRTIPTRQRQLFLDDQDVEKIDNLGRTMHQPAKRGAVIVPDQPWETTLQIRCAPAWDPEARRFKLWMITSTPVEGVAGAVQLQRCTGSVIIEVSEGAVG